MSGIIIFDALTLRFAAVFLWNTSLINTEEKYMQDTHLFSAVTAMARIL